MYRPGGWYYFLTFTAPSELGQHCKRAGCDGQGCAHEKCLCTEVGGINLAEWNPTATKCFNHFMTLLTRRYGSRPAYFRATEVQDGKRRADGVGRGALHFHVILRSAHKLATPTVRQLAIEAGFGHEIKLDPLQPGSQKAASYVAKYVTKSADQRELVPWQRLEPVAWDEDSGEVLEVAMVPAAPTFRTWSQSRSWGTSMKAIRDVARRKWEESQRARETESGPAGPPSDSPGPDPPGQSA